VVVHSLEELNEHLRGLIENDHDLYNWMSGKSEIPPELLSAINRLTAYFLKKK
jgi:succinate dehydrogenase flavin-adding protein (antitoxin of CptAB toxin-antitoxin module)